MPGIPIDLSWYCELAGWPLFVQESADNHKATSAISYIIPFVYSQNRKYNFPSSGTERRAVVWCVSAFLSYRHENGSR